MSAVYVLGGCIHVSNRARESWMIYEQRALNFNLNKYQRMSSPIGYRCVFFEVSSEWIHGDKDYIIT